MNSGVIEKLNSYVLNAPSLASSETYKLILTGLLTAYMLSAMKSVLNILNSSSAKNLLPNQIRVAIASILITAFMLMILSSIGRNFYHFIN